MIHAGMVTWSTSYTYPWCCSSPCTQKQRWRSHSYSMVHSSPPNQPIKACNMLIMICTTQVVKALYSWNIKECRINSQTLKAYCCSCVSRTELYNNLLMVTVASWPSFWLKCQLAGLILLRWWRGPLSLNTLSETCTICLCCTFTQLSPSAFTRQAELGAGIS